VKIGQTEQLLKSDKGWFILAFVVCNDIVNSFNFFDVVML